MEDSSRPYVLHPSWPTQNQERSSSSTPMPSDFGIGGVLSQVVDSEERVVAYFSKALSKPERNYCVTRKELLAIVKTIEHFHKYLYGQEFLIRTDHASLRWLLNFKQSEESSQGGWKGYSSTTSRSNTGRASYTLTSTPCHEDPALRTANFAQ